MKKTNMMQNVTTATAEKKAKSLMKKAGKKMKQLKDEMVGSIRMMRLGRSVKKIKKNLSKMASKVK